MFTADQYELLDFGQGRKLERFGRYVLDRPSPAADTMNKQNEPAWRAADARYQRGSGESGEWSSAGRLPASWQIAHGPLTFELTRTPFGHLGIFPEQWANWDWITAEVARATRPLKVLNLFAYTGGSTLAAAAAGAEVVHVDSAANTVNWARRNAQLSQLQTKPIRWIAEDALKFVRREVRRGNRYDAVILDPPSFGRGPKGEIWKAAEHLELLLAACVEVTGERPQFLLATCHTPQITDRRLAEMIAAAFGPGSIALQAAPLTLHAATGQQLPSGVVCRGTSASDH